MSRWNAKAMAQGLMAQKAQPGAWRNFKMRAADGGEVSKERAMKDEQKSKAEQAMTKAGGMLGKAGQSIMTRKDRLDAEEDKAIKPAKYADGGMVKKKAGAGHSKIAAAHRDKPFMPKK